MAKRGSGLPYHALIPPEILDLPGQFGRSSQVKGEGRGQPLPFNLGALTASFFATTWQGTPLPLVYVGNRTPRGESILPGHYDRPGNFLIFREDSQFNLYLRGLRYTNDMEKLAEGRILASCT